MKRDAATSNCPKTTARSKSVLSVLLGLMLIAGFAAVNPARAGIKAKSGLLAIQIAVKSSNGSLRPVKRVRGWYMGKGSKHYFNEKTDYRGWAFFTVINDIFANGNSSGSINYSSPDFKIERIEFDDGGYESFGTGSGFIRSIAVDQNLPIDLIKIKTSSRNISSAAITWEKSSRQAAYYYIGSFPFSGWTPLLEKTLRYQAKELEREIIRKNRDPSKN